MVYDIKVLRCKRTTYKRYKSTKKFQDRKCEKVDYIQLVPSKQRTLIQIILKDKGDQRFPVRSVGRHPFYTLVPKWLSI